MENLNKKQTQIKLTKLEHMRRERTRTASASSSAAEEHDADKEIERKRRKKTSADDVVSLETQSRSALDEVKLERQQLEEFLFDEANKITRGAIKFILEKWHKLENKLQEKIIENEKLKAISEKPPRSYAEAAAASSVRSSAAISSKVGAQQQFRKEKARYEVILVKPQNEADSRNNEQIKQDVTKKLNSVRSSVRVNSIRQMRNKGVVIEVKDASDIERIKKCELEKVGLKVEKPKKINPSIIIYDVEKEHKVEDLKEDFIRKNLNLNDDITLKSLTEEIVFTHSVKTKDEKRINWVVQIPGNIYKRIMENGRIYMFWRSYRIREFINITRCYKCHGYGHIAKTCKVEEQLCINCGSKEHSRDECTSKEKPSCVNCARARRKETQHDVRNKECPEYIRQLELYRGRIQWL
ncbi:Uncharacterized 50 kDa protein in type I retrotransposable element R1DM [Anthophora retusa]